MPANFTDGKIEPEFTDAVLELAGEIVDYVIAELTENREEWYYKFQGMTENQKLGLFHAIADGFNDDAGE